MLLNVILASIFSSFDRCIMIDLTIRSKEHVLFLTIVSISQQNTIHILGDFNA